MKEGADKLFSESIHEVPQELLLRYVSGNATIAEQRKIEQQMADDPFLADAVEGLMKAHDQQKVKVDLKAIHFEIKNSQPVRPLLNWKRASQAAAAILILAISAWFVNNRLHQSTENIFTEEFEPYPAPPAIQSPQKDEEVTVEPSIPVTPGTQSESNRGKNDEPPVSGYITEEKAKNTPAAPANEMASPAVEDEAAAFNQSAVSENKQGDYAMDTLNESRAAPASQSFSKADAEVATKKSMQNDQSTLMDEVVVSGLANRAAEDQWKQTMQQALRAYDEKNYDEAIVLFESLLKQKSSSDTANFYSGVSHLALNDATKALERLKKVDNQKQSIYYESALWYESLAYLQMNEKKSARSTLEKLIKYHGEYHQKSIDLLKQLE